MFRVYDLNNDKWANSSVYVDEVGNVYVEHNSLIGKLFGLKKLKKTEEGEVVLHGSTSKKDANGNIIYEADICLIDEINTIGFVAFAGEIGAYCIFDEANGEYFVLSNIGDDKIKVIGNLIDSPSLLPKRDASKQQQQQQEQEEAPVQVPQESEVSVVPEEVKAADEAK